MQAAGARLSLVLTWLRCLTLDPEISSICGVTPDMPCRSDFATVAAEGPMQT